MICQIVLCFPSFSAGSTTPLLAAAGLGCFAPDEEDPARLLVNAIVWVEREGQKAIVIGKGGEMLKRVGSSARIELKRMFARPVHLELWVKVKEDWPDNVPALKRLGYDV